jgi:hypothetical protein
MRHHAVVMPVVKVAVLVLIGAATSLLLPAISPVFALQEPTPATTNAPAVPAKPKNLFEALPNLRWDPALNGPLIIVVPQAATPTKPLKKPGDTQEPVLLPFPELKFGEYRTSDLLDYFGRRLVRLRGVTVFAPAQMVVLNTKLGKPDIYAKMQFRDKIQILEATLTPTQWRRIASANGLGIGDLQGEQRDVFTALLPNPFVYQETSTPSGAVLGTELRVQREPPLKKTVTDSQRNGIRLRIHRETRLFLPSVDTSSPFNVGYVLKESPGTTSLSLEEKFDRDPRKIYETMLSETVPSRLKAGQIDFDARALKAPVTFADAETVGELIRRIREATRLEIYVDRRLAILPVSILAAPDAQLRAGELLKALCWSVTGAVRYVHAEGSDSAPPGVFILTDDVEGLGVRWGNITDWSMATFSAESYAKRRRNRILRQQNVLDLIGFAPDETFTPTKEQEAQIEKGWGNGVTRYLGAKFPLNILPEDLQRLARQSAQETNAQRVKEATPSGRPPKLVSDEMVSVSVQLGIRLDVPDVGSIPMRLYDYGGLDSFLPEPDYSIPENATPPPAKTITLAPTLKAGGVLSVTPNNEQEAHDAVVAARQRGLRQVWIASPSESEDTTRENTDVGFQRVLAAAISTARQTGERPLEILAVARVLSVPPRKPGKETAGDNSLFALDRGLNGQSASTTMQNRLSTALLVGEDSRDLEKQSKQTRDWLLPDSPTVIKQVTARLTNLAATPGLAGIVLTDMLAPGYRSPKGSGRNFGENYTALGYTTERRIAAIKSFGCDPIDITLDRGYITNDSPGPFLIEGTAQRIGASVTRKKMAEKKQPADPAQADSLETLAEVSLSSAWGALRFRSARELLDRVYNSLTSLSEQRKTALPIYLQDFSNGVWGWFSTWDQRDKLPVFLDSQNEESYSARAERSAHLASRNNLYRHSYYPPEDPDDPTRGMDTPPPSPAEKFAADFNRLTRTGNKSWDGYVFDLRDLPVNKALEILQSVTPAGKP